MGGAEEPPRAVEGTSSTAQPHPSGAYPVIAAVIFVVAHYVLDLPRLTGFAIALGACVVVWLMATYGVGQVLAGVGQVLAGLVMTAFVLATVAFTGGVGFAIAWVVLEDASEPVRYGAAAVASIIGLIAGVGWLIDNLGAPAPPFKRARLTPEVRSSVMRRDGYRCVRCGSDWLLEIDHIKALVLGRT